MACKKQHRKNDANTGKVSQELVKDKSTLKPVAHDGGGRTWRWRSLHTSLARISAAAAEEGGGRRRSRHFCQRIHGMSFPKVAGVHVPIGDGVYSNRGVEEAPPSSTGGFVQSSQVNNDKSFTIQP